MEDIKYTEKDLKSMNPELVIKLFLNMQNTMGELNKTVNLLYEQVALMNQRKFGKKSERVSTLFELQQFDFGFNEAEVTCDETAEEPSINNLPKKKKKGAKENKLKKITNHREEVIELSEEELNNKYGEGKWKQLPYEEITKLEHHPASFEVVTYKIGVYAKNDNETIVRANRPIELLPGSIVTPSLLASIIHAKYVNAVPLYRQEKTYESSDVCISRQTMANWVIMSGNKYLTHLYDAMKKEMISTDIIHADETPFEVSKDGRSSGSKSYMWVYRTSTNDNYKQIVLYDYRHTRNASNPREYLEDFKGTLVTDGYQVYHKLEKDNPEQFEVAGCWAHLKRKFAELVKSQGKAANGSVANEAITKISNIYHIDNKGKELDENERLKHRQEKVKPLVDKFFIWVKEKQPLVTKGSATGNGFIYAINQEKYLRVFLNNPLIPLDNNAAERSIRPFTIGRKNWVMIDTKKGAKASAIIYSIVETAKANNLKLYDYLNYLLEELPKYVSEFKSDIPYSLLPWSSELPSNLRKQ